VEHDELRTELIEAFPARPLTRELLLEPTNRWQNYDRGDAVLARIEGRTWNELDREFIEAFPELLIFPGDETFGAVLPAYLAYLLALEGYGEPVYATANQLTRKDEDPTDRRIFDARVAAMTAHQRSIVTKIVEHLARRESMTRVMSPAVQGWKTINKESR
jgi:hypothetical protein